MEENGILPTRLQNLADMDVIPLELWSIKFYGTRYKVEGIVRPEDFTTAQKFTSEFIIKRITSTALVDASERFIELVGQIDRTFQIRNGMPEEIVGKFQNGFPRDWWELLKPCLAAGQKTSTMRAIEAPPLKTSTTSSTVQNVQKTSSEPIVTFADETEVQSDREKERRHRQEEREVQKVLEKDDDDDADDADYTIRQPRAIDGGENTPLRYKRGHSGGPQNRNRVFADTPQRTAIPLAASTPNAPPKIAKPPVKFASDADLFAVPVPPTRRPAERKERSESPEGCDGLFDKISEVFSNVNFPVTPLPAARVRAHFSPAERSEGSYYYRDDRYDEDRNRTSRRDRSRSREYDESRTSRKRGYYRSPEGYEYSRRRDDRRRDRYEASSQRHGSSSSGRSVRFEDPYEYDVEQRRRRREDQKLREIERREREIEARLERSKRSRRYSSDEQSEDMADEWERENRQILDDSMLFRSAAGKATNKKRAGRPKKEVKTRSPPVQKPQKARKEPRKRRSEPAETVDLNESIASNRPRRACVTPVAPPPPKRVTWPKRDLDKLRRVIEVKKPTGDEHDWVEVARLLAKDGVTPTDVRTIAETRLKWREPTRDPKVLEAAEEEETKRRNGLAARVKESIRMREEMREGRQEEDVELKPGGENYEPADVSADESLLAIGTPRVPPKKKGGTRASLIAPPVEDSPMTRRSGAAATVVASPKLDATEVAATQKHVHHLSMIQARPGSSMMNTSRANKSIRNGKNTSISVEQGARRAMKMVTRGRSTIAEEDESEEDDDENEEDVTAEEDEIY